MTEIILEQVTGVTCAILGVGLGLNILKIAVDLWQQHCQFIRDMNSPDK